MIATDLPNLLGRGGDSVMAAHARRRDAAMIEVRRHPGEGRVAVLARAGDVQGARARCQDTVVATDTIGDHARMIDARDARHRRRAGREGCTAGYAAA